MFDPMLRKPLDQWTPDDFERVNAALAQMRESFVTFGRALEQAIIAMMPAVNSLWQVVRERYEAAGCPFGPSDNQDNVIRWLKELPDLDN